MSLLPPKLEKIGSLFATGEIYILMFEAETKMRISIVPTKDITNRAKQGVYHCTKIIKQDIKLNTLLGKASLHQPRTILYLENLETQLYHDKSSVDSLLYRLLDRQF